MTIKRTYKQNAHDNIFTSEWGLFVNEGAPFPVEKIRVAGMIAEFLFYLGYREKAIESAYRYSIFMEEAAEKRFSEMDRLFALFSAALYRDLAQRPFEAQSLWQDLIERRHKLLEKEIMRANAAYLFIYEGYALAKLERWHEVAEPVMQGFEGINKGKGIYKAPHKNSLEYGLVGVLLALCECQLNPSSEAKQTLQKRFEVYKQENRRYGRHGYPVIFDLQFSYPNHLTEILPGSDPESD